MFRNHYCGVTQNGTHPASNLIPIPKRQQNLNNLKNISSHLPKGIIGLNLCKNPFSRVQLYVFFLGARPQTPWVGFAEGCVANLLRSRTNAFASFLEKKITT
jgi:hypothetical protein